VLVSTLACRYGANTYVPAVLAAVQPSRFRRKKRIAGNREVREISARRKPSYEVTEPITLGIRQCIQHCFFAIPQVGLQAKFCSVKDPYLRSLAMFQDANPCRRLALLCGLGR
jgi:hypothetical protein